MRLFEIIYLIGDKNVENFIENLKRLFEQSPFRINFDYESIFDGSIELKKTGEKVFNFSIDYFNFNDLVIANLILDEFKCEDNRLERHCFEVDYNDEEIRYIKILRDKFKDFKECKYYFLEDIFATYLLNKSYKLINEIENNLRKLILMFVTCNNGKFDKNNVPDEIREKYNDENNIYSFDFKHLSILIFNRIGKGNNEKIYNLIEDSNNCEKLDFENLKELVPKSNWQIFFQDYRFELIDEFKEFRKRLNMQNSTDEEIIKQILHYLSKKRNIVAHNNILKVDNDFYENLYQLYHIVLRWVEDGISLLKDECKEKSSEVFCEVNSYLSEYVALYEEIEKLCKKKECSDCEICDEIRKKEKIVMEIKLDLKPFKERDKEKFYEELKALKKEIEKDLKQYKRYESKDEFIQEE